MIPIKYPRSFECEPGTIVTYPSKPLLSDVEVTWTNEGMFGEDGHQLPEGYFRSRVFGPWDIPQDEDDRQRIVDELDALELEASREYRRRMDEIASVRALMESKPSMADRNGGAV